MEQKQGIRNFAVNIKNIMRKIMDAKGKPAKLTLAEQNSILQFYLEVVDFINKP